ncbi:MAG: acyl carrier protein [Candidatus Omnitrophica bacterium]|nr:acyl carrier protein [Candidatus Omnitrophota bacterium]
MERSEIEKIVKGIVVEKLKVDPSQIKESSSFVDDLGADSLDTVELIMDFDQKFNVEIPDEDAEKIRTVGDAIKYLEEKTKNQ